MYDWFAHRSVIGLHEAAPPHGLAAQCEPSQSPSLRDNVKLYLPWIKFRAQSRLEQLRTRFQRFAQSNGFIV
jgi:hypothetical protein